ncbi:Multidrug DMT transporter permease [Candidatus Desulfarcum epimagneticum]|uniref:Multidrug DMT transporter permease n=1 Tax=uncultured Desulfobacteraceae bacterium TaxID=218296 RepID=A0A484HDA7_9BACT|nr:Multidrug DMT transporter permease [uncultured Desulfobacteraceae bacterium]
MKKTREMSLAGAAVIVMICVMFGANAAAIKITLQGMGVFASGFFRFSLAAAILFFWAKATGRSLKLEKKNVKQVLIVTCAFSVQFALFILGISKTSASRAALLINLQPFCVLVLAHIFIKGDRITPMRLGGMVIGFLGVACLFAIKGDADVRFRPGDFLVAATALVWACNAIYLKTFIEKVSVFTVTFYHLLLSLPFFLAMSLVFDDAMITAVTPSIAAAFLYQAAACTAFGFIAWNAMLKKYKASAMHSFLFIMPISGVFFSFLILKEPLTQNIAAALALIAAGIVISQWKRETPCKKALPHH